MNFVQIENLWLPEHVTLGYLGIIAVLAVIPYLIYKRKGIATLVFDLKQKFLFNAIFLNVDETKVAILKLIKRTEDNAAILTIDNFGLDLETIWPMLQHTLTGNATKREIRYRGLIIDPESDNIKKFCVGNSNINQGIAAKNIACIKKYLVDHKIAAGTIQIMSYDQSPIIHGFLIDGEHLFLSFTTFDEKTSVNSGLMGGFSPYIYLKKDDASEFKKILFSAYISWFTHWWKNGHKQV